ncbi:hypothetical protein CEUSTIGMA_g7377.t1 [Chlamydomonas eustigma]|uniref:Protein kinase domain-containing protein n=1 Tax=Chlamydomonas eustigma TaxID=1157962 RepID=A0A250XA40_9CHLO|nr:hypothetical protein CEUSTIGMA_g7377.t1 [Chlamydomonas eustigma]|eukprot:GAX79937.1 hypothetical protein CEUSTIGMA_g7377.t1 [Chlamydomonas eustigma]
MFQQLVGFASVLPRLVALSERCPAAMRHRDLWTINEFALVKEIGNGAVSSVYYALCKRSCLKVAIKIYNKSKLTKLNLRQVEREISIHSSMNHPHIVDFYAAFEDAGFIYLVLEYAEGGDLFDAVKRKGGRLSESSVVQQVLHPYLTALLYMHKRRIVHRDIKPENTVFTREQVLKVTDFGLAVNANEERPVTRLGTLDYMAPEVLKCPDKYLPSDNKERSDLAYDEAVDAWAMGVLAYELIVGRPPFGMADREGTMKAIATMRQSIPDWVTEGARSFISLALDKSPGTRSTIAHLLQHPWIMSHKGRRGDMLMQQVRHLQHQSMQRIGSGHLTFSPGSSDAVQRQLQQGSVEALLAMQQHALHEQRQQHQAVIAVALNHHNAFAGASSSEALSSRVGVMNTFLPPPAFMTPHVDLRPAKRVIQRSAMTCLSDGSGGAHRAGGVQHAGNHIPPSANVPIMPQNISHPPHKSSGVSTPIMSAEDAVNMAMVGMASTFANIGPLSGILQVAHGDSPLAGTSPEDSIRMVRTHGSSSFKRRMPDEEAANNELLLPGSPGTATLSPLAASSSSAGSPFSSLIVNVGSSSPQQQQQQQSGGPESPTRVRLLPVRTSSTQLLSSHSAPIHNPTAPSSPTNSVVHPNQYQHQPSRFSKAKRDNADNELGGGSNSGLHRNSGSMSPVFVPVTSPGGGSLRSLLHSTSLPSTSYTSQATGVQAQGNAEEGPDSQQHQYLQQHRPISQTQAPSSDTVSQGMEWAINFSSLKLQSHPLNSPFASQLNSPMHRSSGQAGGCNSPLSRQDSDRSSTFFSPAATSGGAIQAALDSLQVSKLNLGGVSSSPLRQNSVAQHSENNFLLESGCGVVGRNGSSSEGSGLSATADGGSVSSTTPGPDATVGTSSNLNPAMAQRIRSQVSAAHILSQQQQQQQVAHSMGQLLMYSSDSIGQDTRPSIMQQQQLAVQAAAHQQHLMSMSYQQQQQQLRPPLLSLQQQGPQSFPYQQHQQPNLQTAFYKQQQRSHSMSYQQQQQQQQWIAPGLARLQPVSQESFLTYDPVTQQHVLALNLSSSTGSKNSQQQQQQGRPPFRNLSRGSMPALTVSKNQGHGHQAGLKQNGHQQEQQLQHQQEQQLQHQQEQQLQHQHHLPVRGVQSSESLKPAFLHQAPLFTHTSSQQGAMRAGTNTMVFGASSPSRGTCGTAHGTAYNSYQNIPHSDTPTFMQNSEQQQLLLQQGHLSWFSNPQAEPSRGSVYGEAPVSTHIPHGSSKDNPNISSVGLSSFSSLTPSALTFAPPPGFGSQAGEPAGVNLPLGELSPGEMELLIPFIHDESGMCSTMDDIIDFILSDEDVKRVA